MTLLAKGRSGPHVKRREIVNLTVFANVAQSPVESFQKVAVTHRRLVPDDNRAPAQHVCLLGSPFNAEAGAGVQANDGSFEPGVKGTRLC
jgi:hypothetical protein